MKISKDGLEKMLINAKESCFRFEGLESYDVERERDAYQAFLNGEANFPASQEQEDWFKEIVEFKKNGKLMQRVRLVPDGNRSYFDFEIARIYKKAALSGEDIYFITAANIAKAGTMPVYDFWIFDDKTLVKLNYDNKGSFLSAENVGNKNEIAAVKEIKKSLVKEGVPLYDFIGN
jgi:hypothetical protein